MTPSAGVPTASANGTTGTGSRPGRSTTDPTADRRPPVSRCSSLVTITARRLGSSPRWGRIRASRSSSTNATEVPESSSP